MINVAGKKENTYKEKVVIYNRIRVPVNCLYRNEEMCNSMSDYLKKIVGIQYVKANPLTSKILIIFDESIINEDQILSNIKNCITHLRQRSSEPKNNSNEKHKENNYTKKIIQNIKKSQYECETSLALADFDENIDYNQLWHNMNKNSLVKRLDCDLNNGLTNKEALKRSNELGLNVLSTKKRKSLLSKVFDSLNDTSTKLLLGVSAVSFMLGQFIDAAAVLGIILVETVFSVSQKHKAENSILSLNNMLVEKTIVIRDGIQQEIESKNLVPGDIIIVESGDKVPADARIIEHADLKVSESALTGESTSVVKNHSTCNKYTDLADRTNMLYMGTNVVNGKSSAVVVATGMNTEIGKIASMLQGLKIEQTPLEKRMAKFTRKLTRACIVFTAGASLIGVLLGRSLASILTLAVSFSIGALPESLPAVVTISMGVSVQRLAKKNVIVKRLNAVETLGCANVICCDKTGTLTMNEMTVKKLYCNDTLYEVSGSGYNPEGNIDVVFGNPYNSDALRKLCYTGILCNNSRLTKEQNNKWSIVGDPTEGALLCLGRKNNLDEEALFSDFKRIKEIPFDSNKRNMTVVTEYNNEYTAYCKGSFTSVIDKCSTIYDNGETRLFTSTDKQRITQIKDELADQGLRVLVFAYKKLNRKDENLESNFTFIGMVGMEDPPRPGVKESIIECHNAGIKVIMITGDNKNTASAIGKQLGLLKNGLVVSGSELEQMTEKELNSKIRDIEVFARTSPKQKLRIVKAFKRFGYVVAMTGDGVNDAPAIKEANIGIAMGKKGSDVARDAADIVLADDNFSTIVSAIEEGRTTSNNIKNTTKYLLSGSLGEIIAIGACCATTGFLPLVSLQILWINVICETIMGSTLALEPSSEDVMKYKPLKKNAPLVDNKMFKEILGRSFKIGLTSLGIFNLYTLSGASIIKARTMTFANLILTQIMNSYDCRSNKKSIPHKYMTNATLSSVGMLGGILYLPLLNSVFTTVPINPLDMSLLLGTTCINKVKLLPEKTSYNAKYLSSSNKEN